MVRICSFLRMIIVLLACWLPSSASADDFGGWSHFTPVEVTGSEKYKAVFLTPEVYQHVLPNLADLRLVDNSGKQVPYYIQTGVLARQRSEKVIAGRLMESFQAEKLSLGGLGLVSRKDSRDWTSYEQITRLDYEISTQNRQTVITLKNPYKVRIKQLLFDIDENFQRNYSVFNDAKTTYSLQTGEFYNLRFADVDIVAKSIKLKTPLATDMVIIKIDNRDDRPLIIKDIQVEYFVDKLVFPDVGGTPYRLYFGNAKAERARYELELQRGYIEKENQDECRLEIVQSNVPAQRLALPFRGDYLFNGAIIAISLLLIIILVPKLSSRK